MMQTIEKVLSSLNVWHASKSTRPKYFTAYQITLRLFLTCNSRPRSQTGKEQLKVKHISKTSQPVHELKSILEGYNSSFETDTVVGTVELRERTDHDTVYTADLVICFYFGT